jgi:uncharacterized Zn-finger protein
MGHEEFFLMDDREVALTPDLHVRCDGGNGPLGHPAVFMTLEKGGEITCKYCSRRFVHVSNGEAEAIRRNGQRHAA